MSANRELLEQILAHPDDDTCRLVYADWLEEHGQAERADLIRVQIERAALPTWDVRQLPLRIREEALLKKHEIQWKAELPQFDGTWGSFRRGFVATAWFDDYTALEEYATQCWDATPLEGIAAEWPKSSIKPIDAIPNLREIAINSVFVSHTEVERLADSPLLSTVRTLNIRNCSLGPERFRALLTSPHLENLTVLRAAMNSIGDAGVEALVDADLSLTELDLSEESSQSSQSSQSGQSGHYHEDPVIDSAGLRTFAIWPGLRNLRKLTLSGHELGRTGLETLLHENAENLKELHLRNNGIPGHALGAFTDAPDELQLDVLDLGENSLHSIGTQCLASAACLRSLKVLHVDRCELQESSAIDISEASFVNSLRRLNVSDNDFGFSGLATLLDKKLPELHTFQIAHNDLRNDGAELLARSAPPQLQAIDLSRNLLTDHGVEVLAMSEGLANLRVLRMVGNRIGRKASAALTASGLARQLVFLDPAYDDEDPIPFQSTIDP